MSKIEELLSFIDCTQSFLTQSAKILKCELKSKIYLFFELTPNYSFKNGKHHYRLPNGKYHRLDGPARYGNGKDEYFIEGEKYLIGEFWNKMKHSKYANNIMAHILGSRKK